MSKIYDFKVTDITGQETDLSAYKGKKILIVNVASKCGFTSQYKGLEEIYQQHKDQNFVVLGFPCNQFGAQEPGSEEEISKFCELNFGVTFPLFAKVEVNGDNAHPLFEYLKSEAPGLMGSKAIKWNFTKFLIDENGKVLKRYAPTDKPEAIAKEL